jgi:hypothetical protein
MAGTRAALGDAGTTPLGITPLQFNDCVDELVIRSFRARLTPAVGRKQLAVLSLRQHAVENRTREAHPGSRSSAGHLRRTPIVND